MTLKSTTWPDGTPRSENNAFSWRRIAVAIAPQIFDQRAGYMKRFKTAESYENHKRNAREHSKKLRDKAAEERLKLKLNSRRYTDSPTPAQAQAAKDKTRKIQASSNRYKTA